MGENKLVEKLVNFVITKPCKSILLAFLILGAVGFGSSFMNQDFSYRIWFEQDNPKLIEFDAFERKFGSDEMAVVIVHSPSGIFDIDSATLMTELTEDLWQAPEAIRVDSVTNFNWVHSEEDDILVEPLIPDDIELTQEILDQRKEVALNHRTVEGYLVNKTGDVGIIYIMLKPSLDGTPNYEVVVNGFREIIKKYNGKSDHTIYLTGNPVLNHAFKESSLLDFQRLVPFVLLMTLLFLTLSFKRVSGVVLPLIIIGVTVVATMGSGGWMGIDINNLTAIVPQFMIAIAIAVAVHILVSFFQYYNKGLEKLDALRMASLKNFRPTLLTAMSTAIGFYSYTTSPIPPIKNMGVMAGTGTLFSWLFSFMILVPLLALLPLKRKKFEQSVSADEKEVFTATERSMKFSNFIYKNRVAIVIFSSILSITAAYLASQAEVNSDPFKYFDKSYPMTIATDFIEENVGGAVGAEIVISCGQAECIKEPEFLNKVDKYQKWIEDTYSFVSKTVSITDILKDMNKTLNGGSEDQYILADNKELIAQQLFLYTMNLPQGMDLNNRMTLENDSIRLTAMWTIHDSKTALRTIDEYEAKAKEMGLNASVTGKFPLYQSNNSLVVFSFITSLSLAIFLVGLLLIFGLKSIRLGLVSVIPNTIPLILGGGLLTVLGKPLDIGTVIVGSVCLGIAVDDTIHFLANFKKFLKDSDVVTAVAKVFTHTAPALITTTMVLVAAFATFAFGSFVPNQNFGIFVSVILTGALIIDLTFLPALLMMLQSWVKES